MLPIDLSAAATLTFGEGGKLIWDGIEAHVGFDANAKKIVATKTPLGWLSTFIESANLNVDAATGKATSVSIGFGQQAPSLPAYTPQNPVVAVFDAIAGALHP